MKILTSRTSRVVAAVAVQLALVPVAVADQLSARLTGEEYLLEVAPVDPMDPFRGAYVALSYPGLPNSQDLVERPDAGGDVAYVPLRQSGEVWVGETPVADPPEGPYLRCSDEGWRLRCGIESWFLPQEDAWALEQAVNDGRAVARVRVDGRGNAALVDVEVRDH
ncbi:MAG TPA: GDYXXLXY domain-containing protein [Nocardioidaceae bacterium]|nr:GDYXXLXY domain-containing protein [Nocardioidaceae bacterium]